MFKDICAGQVWRLITPAFMHGGWLHILFNMMWMVDLGRRIEPIKGSARFIGLVLGIAVISNVAQASWYAISPWEVETGNGPAHFEYFLGMSGVVSGLFGYAWMCGRYRPYERIFVNQQETGLHARLAGDLQPRRRRADRQRGALGRAGHRHAAGRGADPGP